MKQLFAGICVALLYTACGFEAPGFEQTTTEDTTKLKQEQTQTKKEQAPAAEKNKQEKQQQEQSNEKSTGKEKTPTKENPVAKEAQTDSPREDIASDDASEDLLPDSEQVMAKELPLEASPEENNQQENSNQRDDTPGTGCTDGDKVECYSGPPSSKNRGICRPGSKVCVQGVWSTCIGDIKPTTETCNGKDDDCDGQIDEELPNAGKICTTGVGECQSMGRTICRENQPGTICNAPVKPKKTEVCDGKDNDCDGQTDEDFRLLKSSCTVGQGQCLRKGTYICTLDMKGVECSTKPGIQSTEVCDGKDNDCDGQTDEDFVDLKKACSTGIGECKAHGVFVCSSDHSGVICKTSKRFPRTEICDGKDNDCDGQTDEDFECSGEMTKSCGSDTGSCKKGVQTCTNQCRWSACKGEVSAKTEICNNQDDDCDGQVDEQVTKKCYNATNGRGQGICRDGTATCTLGKWGACKGEVHPKTPTCNNKDNDCDGKIDPCTSMLKKVGNLDAQIVESMAVDASGNIYVVGHFWGTLELGRFTLKTTQEREVFLAKYSSTGAVVWAKAIQGISTHSNHLKVNSFGHLIIATQSDNNVVIFGSQRHPLTSHASTLLMAINTQKASVIWMKTHQRVDGIDGMDIDQEGNIAIMISFNHDSQMGTKKHINQGLSDVFVAKFSTTGDYLWSHSFGGKGYESPNNLVFDKQGNLYFHFNFRETDVKVDSITHSNPFKKYHSLVVKFTPNGQVSWSKSFVPKMDEEIDKGNIFITEKDEFYWVGTSKANKLTFDSVVITKKLWAYMMFLKLSPSTGKVLKEQTFHAHSDIHTGKFSSDKKGNIFMAFRLNTTAVFGQKTLNPMSGDLWLLKFTPNWKLEWYREFGNRNFGHIHHFIRDSQGSMVVLGSCIGDFTFDGLSVGKKPNEASFLLRMTDPTK